MPLVSRGLAKLLEEMGELAAEAGKKLAYMHTDEHPDGKGSMAKRIENEMADVLAAMDVVAFKLGLDLAAIEIRARMKIERFLAWDADPNS